MYIAPTTTIIRWLEPYNYTNCNSPSLRPYRRPTLLLKYHAIPSSDSSFYSNTQRLSGQQLSATFLALDCRKFISFNPVTRVHTFTYVQSPLRRWQCTASNLSVIALDRRERHAETFNKVNLASRASVMASRLAIGRLDSWLAGWLTGWFAGSLLASASACFNSASFNDALLRCSFSCLFSPAFVRLCLARLTEPLTALCIAGSCCVETKKCPCKLPSQNNGFPRGAGDSRAT